MNLHKGWTTGRQRVCSPLLFRGQDADLETLPQCCTRPHQSGCEPRTRGRRYGPEHESSPPLEESTVLSLTAWSLTSLLFKLNHLF